MRSSICRVNNDVEESIWPNSMNVPMAKVYSDDIYKTCGMPGNSLAEERR